MTAAGRRRLVWIALGSVVVIAVAVAMWLWAGDASTASSPSAAGPDARATVERGTISATRSWDGKVDHGPPFTVKSGLAGTITRLIDQGKAVERGTELYRVNERPVTVLQGTVPMYRNLGPGDSGADVEQLERNLAVLGYGGFTADAEYTSSTGTAVRAWQAAIGVAQSGTVARGDVVFVPELGRVDVLRVDVGDAVSPGAAVLDITGTAKAASLEADVADRNLFAPGTTVTVALPDGGKRPGTVGAATVAEVSAEPNAGAGGEAQARKTVTKVRIALSGDIDESLVGAAVTVVVSIDERKDVLLVPVNALLALSEGGYGLEVLRGDGTTRIVAVDTGLFADGKVQVDGDGIAEGTVVGVAGR